MKIAVSNIAWPAELDGEILEGLAASGVSALEVAPTRVWPQWEGITADALTQFRARVESCGLQISSLQSVLFQKPDLQLFRTPEPMREHLRFCSDIANSLGATRLVFGSPKNRDRGTLDEASAIGRAAECFAPVAEEYASRGLVLAFEANPAAYACNFATDSSAAAALVRAVGSRGFGLHLDTACMHLAGEGAAASIAMHGSLLTHFHASEPQLGDFSAPVAQHQAAAEALRSSGYQGAVAIEMRAGNDPAAAVRQAVEYVRGLYA